MASSSRASLVVRKSMMVRHSTRRPMQARSNSTAAAPSSSPSSKICAVPFKQTPEQAMTKMHMHGLLASAEFKNLLYAGLLYLFGPGVSSFAKEFGLGDTLKLREMKAVLYPVWRVDCVLEGRVESEKGGKSGKAWLGIREGYVPGNPFAPLSYLSFAVPPLPDDLPKYNPSKDLRQLGEGFDVVPVPFTVSPLGLLKKIRKIIGRRTSWEGLKVDESKWQENMVAMYPLMFPIYVAEFEHTQNGKDRRYTMIMDAHDETTNNCRVSWPPPPAMVEMGRFNENYYVNPAPFLPMCNLLLPHSVLASPNSNSNSPPPTARTLSQRYLQWMSPAPTSLSSIPPSPLADSEIESAGVDWEDVRVQSWSGEERQENGDYMEKGLEVQKGIGALENLAEVSSQLPEGADPQGTVVNISANSRRPTITQKPMSEIKAQLAKDVEELKKGLEEAKPGWLKEWEKAKSFAEDGSTST